MGPTCTNAVATGRLANLLLEEIRCELVLLLHQSVEVTSGNDHVREWQSNAAFQRRHALVLRHAKPTALLLQLLRKKRAGIGVFSIGNRPHPGSQLYSYCGPADRGSPLGTVSDHSSPRGLIGLADATGLREIT